MRLVDIFEVGAYGDKQTGKQPPRNDIIIILLAVEARRRPGSRALWVGDGGEDYLYRYV